MKLTKYIVVAALLASSCNDFLDQVPDNRVDIETPEQIRQLLVDAYSKYNYATVCEFSTDNVVDNNSPDENGNRYNLTYRDPADLEAFAWDDIVSNIEEDSPSMIWAGCYHAIAVCNNALEAIAKLEAKGRGNEVLAHKGEALISRAYHHFVLANIFSMAYAGEELSENIPSVPYMDKLETEVLVHYKRESLASVYRKIETDILEALPLIDDGLYDVPKYHFNKTAAYAFAARFYLYKRDYENVEKYATMALGGEGADPSAMMRKFWKKSFTTYDALVAAYTSAQEQSNFMLVPTYSVFTRSRGGRFALNRDAQEATIMSAGPTWPNYNFHPCYSGKIYIRGSQEYGSFFPKAGELFEYTDKVAGIGFAHIVRCEFTAEETLLARAEARLYLNRKADAIEDLKIWDAARRDVAVSATFRDFTEANVNSFYRNPGYGIVKPLHIDEVCPSDKYSLTDDIETMIQCVLHLRRIETIDDGYRWFDIKRYGIEITHNIGLDRVETLVTNDPRTAIQIPAEVIAAGFTPNMRVSSKSANSFERYTGSFLKKLSVK
ncbi:MAG: RagB/SusD family nutrient uptake outer membrane protein [Bacteroidaceae bacterium]|nr:RagB/SusD family nutrient uptake outer membrane protein [Bacteroidaceae bacterium]